MAPGAAPHDLGAPGEDPIVNPNQYNYQDVSNWRDLNSKYVLMVWRDYVYSGRKDRAFLEYNYKAIKQAMDYLKQFDSDGDGTFGDNTKTLASGTFTINTKDNVAEGVTLTATSTWHRTSPARCSIHSCRPMPWKRWASHAWARSATPTQATVVCLFMSVSIQSS